ncbi:hypothetical protein ACWEF9_09625 [Streptomyces sp. NPDC004980]
MANRGVDEVLATGTVRGNYRFETDRQEFQHTVPVDWDLSHAQRLPEPRQWRSTFARVDPAFFAKLTAYQADSGADANQEPQSTPVALPEDVQTVLDALKRKGQVVLHGPPGTARRGSPSERPLPWTIARTPSMPMPTNVPRPRPKCCTATAST